VDRGLASSRSQAQRLIAAGVKWLAPGGWKPVGKNGDELPHEAEIELLDLAEARYVSRGGLKLEAALKTAGIEVKGKDCLDVGQSTGGFTDCLLQHGAAQVVGIDVGQAQLHPKIRADGRVVCVEQVNARHLDAQAWIAGEERPEGAAAQFDLVVGDLSFISLTLVLPAVVPLTKAGAHLLLLVKPQFELQPAQIGKHGLVKDAAMYAVVEQRIRDCCAALGLPVRAWFESAIPGSFEFFPPKTPEGADKLRVARKALYALKPEFCSVTYGAGGSTQSGTFSTVSEILEEGVGAASHFSCIGATRDSVREQLGRLKAMGVKRLVALRGDLPSGYGTGGEFQYASDLVAFVRAHSGSGFHVEVACYPEVHPQARSPESDLQAFATKVRSGADSAITQYFYNSDAYFRFLEDTARIGVAVPVVPGIMPITSSTQLMRFSDACGAEIPRWIRLRLQGFGDDSASIRAFGLDVVAELCERLRRGGAPGLHFYTMNQSAATLELCRRLGL
jgi:methylenetetrahydrofolate reductase (NADPH)